MEGERGHKKAAILDSALRSTMDVIRDPEHWSTGVAVTSTRWLVIRRSRGEEAEKREMETELVGRDLKGSF